jgi:hypothetical protein
MFFDPYYGSSYGYFDIFDFIGPIMGVIISIIVIGIIVRIIRSKKRKNGNAMEVTIDNSPSSINTDTSSGFLAMRGRTGEQKKVIKYFKSTGILGAIFKISNSTFDTILNNKLQKYGEMLNKRALSAHGMDADEVNEIAPIRVEGYALGSRFLKVFRDLKFRASEYQMSYLMFSDKQMYAYSLIFDLTSANTSEQTREYFYEDISAIDVTVNRFEYPNPRPYSYIFGGIAAVLVGLILALFTGEGIGVFFGVVFLIAGLVLLLFLGYTKSVIVKLILRLTVANDEFICPMKLENMPAVMGMKAKIREKKR